MNMMVLGSQMVSPAVALFCTIHQAQRTDGLASVLSIGTAVPPNCVLQDEYADYYFRIHYYAGLKEKLHRLCMYSLGSFISITFGSGMRTNIVIKESR
jgi:hypothetical protein